MIGAELVHGPKAVIGGPRYAISGPLSDVAGIAHRAWQVAYEVKWRHSLDTVTSVTFELRSDTWPRPPSLKLAAIMTKRSIAVGGAALLFGIAAAAAVPIRLLGQPAVPGQAQRTVVITPTTRYVNVTEGDVVRFVADGKVFAFNFDSGVASSFALNRVAPAGVLDHTVIVYVARNLETQP